MQRIVTNLPMILEGLMVEDQVGFPRERRAKVLDLGRVFSPLNSSCLLSRPESHSPQFINHLHCVGISTQHLICYGLNYVLLKFAQ